jgi:glycosyltransferase involved in cell wall biosynthesis
MRSLHLDTARTWRGGQNQVLLLVTGLESAGHPAVLVSHEDGELRRRAGEGLRYVGFAPRSEFDVHAAWQLAKILADVKPDVVHAHDPMGVALAAMALQMQHGLERRPRMVAARRVDFHLKRHALSRWKYRQIDLFIAASKAIAGVLADDGVPADRIAIVHDGIDLSFVDRQPALDVHKTFWLPHGAPVVGNVAALAGHKGQRHLVAAAARVCREVPDARIVILGEGDERPALERQIKELGLERHVLLAGFRPDAIGLMKAFDVFVMSSVTEGLGSAVLEAMACRRPVVATRAGGIPEVVEDGVSGLLVPPADEDALADAIVRVLRDPSVAASLSAAGRTRVESAFSVEMMVEGTLRAYRG